MNYGTDTCARVYHMIWPVVVEVMYNSTTHPLILLWENKLHHSFLMCVIKSTRGNGFHCSVTYHILYWKIGFFPYSLFQPEMLRGKGVVYLLKGVKIGLRFSRYRPFKPFQDRNLTKISKMPKQISKSFIL